MANYYNHNGFEIEIVGVLSGKEDVFNQVSKNMDNCSTLTAFSVTEQRTLLLCCNTSGIDMTHKTKVTCLSHLE
ncbi:hypothetical protein P7K49_008212 [Saguinus oedipus]|uniref:Uncharacterized protein n=1 Tax=Saguinus oedipus TaxID=9490 RepID=A0ABQ9VXU0_SAGOE|nr:hypothetical protein P7K49_008212 [Saguinus oedipus]